MVNDSGGSPFTELAISQKDSFVALSGACCDQATWQAAPAATA